MQRGFLYEKCRNVWMVSDFVILLHSKGNGRQWMYVVDKTRTQGIDVAKE